MMTSELDIRELIAEEEHAGDRVDRWLTKTLIDFSRSRLKVLIEEGQLTCNGSQLTDPSAKVLNGASYQIIIPAPRAAEPQPEKMDLDIRYEDDELIVLHKPCGMTVHPAAGNWTGTLVHGLLHHCAGSLSGIGGVERPGIVHRIDKDTSGILVVAKTDVAHKGLSEQFAAHTVERAYIAFTRNSPRELAGRIETQLVRSSHDRKKFTVPHDPDSTAGRHAITNYKTLKRYGTDPKGSIGSYLAAKLECRLETGRTHQIRVHMAHINCSLLGDPLYGARRGSSLASSDAGRTLKGFNRQALHAAALGFDHPVSGKKLRFESNMPEDMKKLEAFLSNL